MENLCESCGSPVGNGNGGTKFVNKDWWWKKLPDGDPRRWHWACSYDCAENLLKAYDANNDKRYNRLLQMIPTYRDYRENLESKSVPSVVSQSPEASTLN